MSQSLVIKNFGWTEDQFMLLKSQVQQDDVETFREQLMPHLKECSVYCLNLAKKWLKKTQLDTWERQLIKDAMTDAFVRFEQRMNNDTVQYGNLHDWLVGNAFSRFQDLFDREQKEIARLAPIDNVQIPIRAEREEDLMVFLVAKVLEKMPNDAKYFYQKTLKMLYWQGYSIEEIAEDIQVGYENLRKELSAKIRPLFKSELTKLAMASNVDLTKHRMPLHGNA